MTSSAGVFRFFANMNFHYVFTVSFLSSDIFTNDMYVDLSYNNMPPELIFFRTFGFKCMFYTQWDLNDVFITSHDNRYLFLLLSD